MNVQDLLKLVGVAIVVIGLALRLRTTLVVVVAALATGLVAGLPLFSHEGFFQHLPYLTEPGRMGIVNTLGKAFADNRLMTLFIITLPAIGLAERYGLQEQAANLIRKIRAATVGRLQIVYQLFRVLHGLMGIRLNGHPSFVRPLIFPMSVGAAQASESVPRAVASGTSVVSEPLATARGTDPDGAARASGTSVVSEPLATARGTDPDGAAGASGTSVVSEPLATARGTDPDGAAQSSDTDRIEKIKAANAAAENYGNFYGQNLSPVQAGILLVAGVMQGLGLTVGLWDLVRYTIPIVVASIVLAVIQFRWLDRALGKMAEAKR